MRARITSVEGHFSAPSLRAHEKVSSSACAARGTSTLAASTPIPNARRVDFSKDHERWPHSWGSKGGFMRTRWLVGTLFVALATYSGWEARPAAASVSTPCTFTALVHDTTLVAVAMPVEQNVVWEGGRIVTYSRLRVDRVIAAGSVDIDPPREVWVATLGGIVQEGQRKVGQIVDGEPRFDVGRGSLVFLKPDVTSPGTGVHRVVARAQGQFAIVTDTAKKQRLVASHVDTLERGAGAPPTTRFAADALAGATVDDAATTIAIEWRKSHAH
jgi:hypothetical protein